MEVFNKGKFGALLRLMRIDRPIGNLLLMYPMLWALWMAGSGRPNGDVFLVFMLGLFVMRAAGCVINDYADRHVDGHVERTKLRPLATGEVSEGEALALFLALLLIALGLVLWLDPALLMLAFVGAALAASYPFMKRYTHLPQFYLGVAFGWSVPLAYAAQLGALPADCWWLFVANIFWSGAYDTAYAMVDRDDDLKIGVKSTAILFGQYDRAAIFGMQGVTLVCLAIAGVLNDRGGWFALGLIGAALFAVYQQFLLRDRDRDRCFAAFLNNNWFGAAVFIGLVLDYTLR